MGLMSRKIIAAAALACAIASLAARAQEVRLGAFQREIADLSEPVASAISGKGEIYVVEAGAHRVRVFDRAGIVLRGFGRFGAGAAEFIAPSGIAIGPAGELFVADSGNHRIQVLDPFGAPLRTWGTHGAEPGAFNRPAALAVTAQFVYVADTENARVQVFDLNGTFVRSIGSFGDSSGKLSRPVGVAVDSAGAIYVADADNNRIEVFAPDGSPLRRWGEWGSVSGLLSEPASVAHAGNRLFVTDRINHRIQVFTPEGAALYQWGVHAVRPREGNGSFHYPVHIALAPSLDLAVVCEPIEDRVQIFSPRPLGDAGPRALIPPADAMGSHFGMRPAIGGGLLAIAEQDGRGIILYELRGREPIEIHRFGSFGAGNGKFRRPEGLSLDADGRRLIVSDLGQRRLQIFRLDRSEAREIRYLPFMSRLARTVDFDALDRALTESLRHGPFEVSAICQDHCGNLYMLDARNGRVVSFTRDFAFRHTLTTADGAEFRFRRPTDLALAPDESRLFVVDAEARQVAAFDRTGRVDSSFTIRTPESAKFDQPFGIVAIADGRVFVTDVAADRVLAFGASGEFLSSWGGSGLGRVQFRKPRGVAIDDADNLFVVDHGNHRCQILTPAGEFVDAFGARLFILPAKRGPQPTTQRKPAASRPVSAAPANPLALRQPTTRPASPPWQRAIVSNDGSYLVEFRTRPDTIPINDMFSIDVRVSRAASGEAMPADYDLSVDAGMPEHLHGMNTEPKIQHNSDGTFTVRGMQFHMAGYWELYFDISAGGISERAQIGVTLE
jgi:DNA-binding beta-propeller fold protein YncE